MKVEEIPSGLYCYNKKGVCPFWSIKENLPYMENGYCSYLGKSDYDLNEEIGGVETYQGGLYVGLTDAHEAKMSLLWDKCKECGINEP